MKARIYLKGGAVIETRVKSISVGRSPLGNRTSLKWESRADEGQEVLMDIDVEEVAAVTTEHEPGDEDRADAAA